MAKQNINISGTRNGKRVVAQGAEIWPKNCEKFAFCLIENGKMTQIGYEPFKRQSLKSDSLKC